MNETPRNEEEIGGTVQPNEPLRSPEEQSDEGLTAQPETEEDETEVEGEEADEDEDEDKRQ
jgi:hypothetical protein